MLLLIALVSAAILGACGPLVMRAMPEPEPAPEESGQSSADSSAESAAEQKILYAELAQTSHLRLGLALGSLALAAIALVPLRDSPEYFPAWVVFCAMGSWLTFIDWHTRLLPFVITVPLHLLVFLAIGFAALVEQEWSILLRGIIANVVIFVFFWIFWFIGQFMRAGGLGYGDVRLGAVIGLILGPLGLITTIAGSYAGFIIGAIAGVVLSIAKIVDRTGFAFGPYLVVGAVLGPALGRVFGS